LRAPAHQELAGQRTRSNRLDEQAVVVRDGAEPFEQDTDPSDGVGGLDRGRILAVEVGYELPSIRRWTSSPSLPPKDVDTLRTAMHGGVVHYLVKPFSFNTLRERLERYAAHRVGLARMSRASRHEIDRLYSLLRMHGTRGLPKGISAPTLALVVQAIEEVVGEVSAFEVAAKTGISRGTAQRYFEYLAGSGLIELMLRYGATGRPEHLYRYVPPPSARVR
jgi:hypothetical protein